LILTGLSAVLFLTLAQPAQAKILATFANFFSLNLISGATASTETTAKGSALPAPEVGRNLQNFALPEPVSSNATSSPKAELGQSVVGGQALLAESGPLGTAADLKDNQPPSDLISVYVVHPGDTLETVAKLFNVSVNTVRWANDLKKGDTLRVGDQLVILPITGLKLTVKAGDTLQSLAKKYHGDVGDIIAYNDFDPTKDLTVGQTIIIPDGEEQTIVSSPKATPKASAKYKGPSYAGYFMRPIVGGRKSQGLHGHNAVDLAAPRGTAIYAAASGRVILARTGGWNGGYGNYFVIAHPNGTQTLYSHADKVFVSSGQPVTKGDMVGTVGSTGRSTGYHLHFEIRGAVNPF